MATLTHRRRFIFINNSTNSNAEKQGADDQVRTLIRSHAARTENSLVAPSKGLKPLITPQIRVERKRKKRRQKNGTIQLKVVDASDGVDAEIRSDGSVGDSPNAGAVSAVGANLQSPYSMLRVLEGGWTGPFSSVHIPQGGFVPMVINHYISFMAIPVAELDNQYESNLLSKRWFPMAISNTATFHVIVLTAAAHYLSRRHIHDSPPSSPTGSENRKATPNPDPAVQALLNLKQQTLHSINTLIRDPDAASSDATIAAVAKMASYEAMFGDPREFHAHMHGLRRILAMRGGLSGVEPVLGGLLRRMLLWIDCNAAFLLKSRLYFAAAAGGQIGLPVPDPARFDPSRFLASS